MDVIHSNARESRIREVYFIHCNFGNSGLWMLYIVMRGNPGLGLGKCTLYIAMLGIQDCGCYTLL